MTNKLLLSVDRTDLSALLDKGADLFAQAVRSQEGMEGMMAFMQKRLPKWAEEEK